MRCKETIYFPDIDRAFGGRFQCQHEEGHGHLHMTTDAGYETTFTRNNDLQPYGEGADGERREILRFKIWWENE